MADYKITRNVIRGVTKLIRAKSTDIKRARIEQGYNQSDVCEGTGLNLASYNQIENGKTSLRPKTAKKICDFLKKSFSELFEIVEKEAS
jgi:DNA-binding XRE family transcriptional regulator